VAGFVQAIGLDLDGTLTDDSGLSAEAMSAIASARERGIAVVMVTGRILCELQHEFPGLHERFDAVVAENGAVLLWGGVVHDLAAPVDEELVEALAEETVPVRRGRVILASEAPYFDTIMRHLDRLGLDCQLLRNRTALMVLPAGISKGTGFLTALEHLGISAHNAVAIGDAENDLACLDAAELGVAVANSVSSLKRHADLVLTERGGRALAAFLDGPVISGERAIHPQRRRITIGEFTDGHPATVPGAQANIMICGDTGVGKSYLAGLLVERWVESGYIVLVVDMEGDYISLGQLPGIVVLSSPALPTAHELSALLAHPAKSVVLDMSALSGPDKATYLTSLRAVLRTERAAKGVPHWIVVEEAQSSLSAGGVGSEVFRPGDLGYCLVTYQPDALAVGIRTAIDMTLTVTGAPPIPGRSPAIGSTALYSEAGTPPQPMTVAQRQTPHRRHWQKYVTEPLPPHLWFQFRHADGQDAGTARNIAEFDTMLELADPVVVENHLLRGDFSRWLTGAIQDRDLAAVAAATERDFAGHRAAEVQRAREHLRTHVEARYHPPENP